MSLGEPEAFISREIQVGGLKLGGLQPIVVQSMTTTDTSNVAATVDQCLALFHSGCDLVRITAPTVQDAEKLGEIRQALWERGYRQPLVADIHFQPKAAMIAAEFVEKVRINPGNFADRKLFKSREYTDSEYREELDRIDEVFSPLVKLLKGKGRALRIGTNHGSLSDRVMNRFGDTPEGMVQSAFEYAEICRKHDFHDFCFSMKASNVGVMVEAYRLLVDRQRERAWNYPIHLGVTEAGDGEDARIKSFVGIGSLLAEGIGDTIRVSLTESPLREVPVARALANRFNRGRAWVARSYRFQSESDTSKLSQSLPLVWLKFEFKGLESLQALSGLSAKPDVLFFEELPSDSEVRQIKFWASQKKGLETLKIAGRWSSRSEARADVDFWLVGFTDGLDSKPKNAFQQIDSLDQLKTIGAFEPERSIFVREVSAEKEKELDSLMDVSLQMGTAYVDIPLGGCMLTGLPAEDSLRIGFGVLQATRRRMSKTEYIACPSCGRTLFDLEETTARIRKVTSHLKGVKIAIMGCIVNGPGEMADADFGYVGGAPGKVNLYVQKECVARNIPSSEAPERLVALIKEHGKWVEVDSEEELRASS